jgi:hypothetical protein
VSCGFGCWFRYRAPVPKPATEAIRVLPRLVYHTAVEG